MIELLLLTPATRVDEVSDILMELDALAVTVEDADADTPDEAPIFGDPLAGRGDVRVRPPDRVQRAAVEKLHVSSKCCAM